jgi:ArsR family transcriptional regulator, arsenate/arsenite/antimonite-responsive transcriptional repressor
MTIITNMSTATRPSAAAIDKVFRAFADRTRLRILSLLRDGELCVSDLITILKVPQAKASHHLNYLRRAGLVQVRKSGLWCFYRLRPAPTTFHEKLLDCLGECFTDVPELAADRQRAAKVKAAGGCCPREAPMGKGKEEIRGARTCRTSCRKGK